MDYTDAVNAAWSSLDHPKPNVIFLDIDGVLSNSRCLMHEIESSDAIFTEHGEYPLERRCLNLLHHIVTSTDAKVVLSTTWRLEPEMRAHILSSFEKIGGEQFRECVIGDTPKTNLGRGFEIQLWLETNGASNIVIFEDSKRHFATIEAAGLSEHLIKTKIQDEDWNMEGITDVLAERAIKMLNATASLNTDGTLC